jgi:hypothetical protein
MCNHYVVLEASDSSLTIKRYLNGPGIPYVNDTIFHNTVVLASISDVVQDMDNYVLTPDHKLPYILIGTVLTIGTL